MKRKGSGKEEKVGEGRKAWTGRPVLWTSLHDQVGGAVRTVDGNLMPPFSSQVPADHWYVPDEVGS